jgi:hypothetical protein
MVQVTYNPTTYSTDDTGAQVSSAELTGTVPCTAPESAAVLVVPTSWDDGMVIADPNPQALEPSAVQAMAPVRIKHLYCNISLGFSNISAIKQAIAA